MVFQRPRIFAAVVTAFVVFLLTAAGRSHADGLAILVPTSEATPQIWSYTTQPPANNWAAPGFDAGTWKTGPAPFGQGYPVNTPWTDTPGDIWLRRIVTLPATIPAKLNVLAKHDEDVEVYVNGVLAASATGYTGSYAALPMSDAARAALIPGGSNVIAVHCHQTVGGQVIDVGIVEALAQFTPIRPPSVPLITRTPYVSEWLQSTQAPGSWPNFWRDNTMGLTLMADVDGQAYVLLGAPGGAPNATQLNLQITATQSIFTFLAGPVSVTADFLSPVEANDLRRLSMPLGDITLQAQSADSAAHHVQLYCDMTGEWAYGDTSALINWTPETINHWC